jgi:hypothetical protein
VARDHLSRVMRASHPLAKSQVKPKSAKNSA